MVAYSFKARFGPLISVGLKRQTIRSDRKRHARPGETLQLYTGMRTRQCKLIGEAECIGVDEVQLILDDGLVLLPDRSLVHRADIDHFARQDGFENWPDLAAFWAAEHPGITRFTGVLIRWGALLEPIED